ncbi:diacylglycerol kinase family protein [Reichenbachiella sp. MALMAid0571]|uniref:diacylglycerol/lipid kinase family protein n=1 Tax=Reichenbachiella sp. MALMAid0571 TaxID=3143939 RepID=UPI0032DE9363
MAERKKILFIVNPISGVKKKISIDDLVKTHLDHNQYVYKIHFTTSRGDAIVQSKKAVADNYDVVVAVGGDGTINEVAQGLINSNVALGVIPRGSGNGFANYFKIPHDPIKAIEVINRPNSSLIDTGTFNDKLFLSVAGLGFDARVSAAFDVFGRRGLLSYIYISAREYFRFQAKSYSIELNDLTIKTRAFLLTAANSSQFGNNAFIAPNAKIDDGLLDFVIIKPANIFNALIISIRMFNGTLHKSKYCEIYKTDKIKITHEDNVAQIDGEPVTIPSQTTISLKSKSLWMIS